MIKTNLIELCFTRYQQANNNIYLYIYTLILFSCLLIKTAIAQDSHFKQFFYPTGELSSEGYFINNLPAGEWRNYYKNGNLKSIGYRKNALLDSTWTFYDSLGRKKLQENYLNNQKQGKVIKYDTNNNLISIMNYNKGQKEGEEVIYFQDTNIINFKNDYLNDKKNGINYEYNKMGFIISIIEYDMGVIISKEEINRRDRDGEKHGIWRIYFSNGKIKKEEKYIHGVIHGVVKKYNKKGGIIALENFNNGEETKDNIKLEVNISTIKTPQGTSMKGVLYNNNKHGLFKVMDSTNKIINYQYYKNNTLIKEGMYDSLNQKTGLWKYYWLEGNIKKTGYYKGGKKHSEWNYYFLNGDVQQKGKYNKGLPVGEWVWWYKNKQKRREENYLNGKENGLSIEYDSLGNIITKGEFNFGEREGRWLYIVNDYQEEGEYVSGMKTGEWLATYINTGKRKYEKEYLNGIQIGKHVEYYDNGIIKELGKFEFGEKEGEWKKYNIDGGLIVTYLYERGEEKKRDGYKIK